MQCWASKIITHIGIAPGNEADGDALPEMLQQSTVKTQILLGDTAYGTLDARDTMESQNVVPVAPLPMGSKKVGHFGKHEFVIDFIQNSCRCPAGKITTRVRKKGGQISSYVFLPKTCNRCELRDQCTKHGTGRVVGVHSEEDRRRLIIKQTETEEFKTLSSCIHCGSRQSKTTLHNCQGEFMRIAAIGNVHGSRRSGVAYGYLNLMHESPAEKNRLHI